MKVATALDPLSALIMNGLASSYYFARQYDLALKAYKDTIELDPGFASAYQVLAGLYARKGEPQEAFALLEKSLAMHGFPNRDHITRALVLVASGRSEDARKELLLFEKGNGRRYVIAPGAAFVHAALGENDKALDLLEEAYERRVGSLVFIANHPGLDNPYGHPRFMNLLHCIGLASRCVTI
jgi:tetratricopeptide (TPR) repeat protein